MKNFSIKPEEKRLAILLAFFIVLVTVFIVFYLTKFFSPHIVNAPGNQTLNTANPTEAVISITANGFSPETISVAPGTVVSFTNLDTAPHLIASDPYPNNNLLPSLISPALLKDESYAFIFDKVGTFTYHDNLNPFTFKGT